MRRNLAWPTQVSAEKGSPRTKEDISLRDSRRRAHGTVPGNLAPRSPPLGPWAAWAAWPSPPCVDMPQSIGRRAPVPQVHMRSHPHSLSSRHTASRLPLPASGMGLEPQRDPRMDAGCMNTSKGLIRLCWMCEVGPAGTSASPTRLLNLPLPVQQLPPPHSHTLVSVLCFPPWPNPLGFFGH